MASSSSSSSTFILLQTNRHSNAFNLLHISTLRNGGGQFSLFGGPNKWGLPYQLRATGRKPRKDLVVRINASPNDPLGDFFASFSSLSNFNIPELLQNPWVPGIAGLMVGSVVPVMIQRLLLLSDKIDNTAEAVERIADRVVEAAEDWEKSLPEGGLRRVVGFVEEMAEETAKGAQKVSDLMDKVDEMTDTLQDRFETDPEPELEPQLGPKIGFSQSPVRSYAAPPVEEPSPECEICRILKLFDF